MSEATRQQSAGILRFVRQRVGQVVGDGECFTLADNALKDAGLKSASDYGQVGPRDFYVWGAEIPLNSARPGDILQFRNFRAVVRTENDEGWQEEIQTRAHHTAILVESTSTGPAVIFESNVEGNRAVQRNQLFLRSRPARQTDEGTVTVGVTGRVQAYRPQQP